MSTNTAQHEAAAAPALACAAVSVTYPGGVRALDSVSLAVGAGELVALVGPNGSGKSTLLSVLGLMGTPDGGGAVRIDGAERSPADDAVRAGLGLVFQNEALDGVLTVGENVELFGVLGGLTVREARERSKAALAQVGMAEHELRKASALSGGQRRRVDLARALVHEPKTILLDEPTAGLDVESRGAFFAAIEKCNKEQGATVVYTTHDATEAALASRVVVLDRGVVIADGAPKELVTRFGERVLKVELTDEADADGADDVPLEHLGSLAHVRTAHGVIAWGEAEDVAVAAGAFARDGVSCSVKASDLEAALGILRATQSEGGAV